MKDLKHKKINSVNTLYLIFSKVNRYFKETNKNKYLTPVPTNESNEKIKKYDELWSKIKDLIRSITKHSNGYHEKYMKIKFNSDDALPPNKTTKIPSMIIVVRAIFLENQKYYLQVFLDDYLHEL